MIELIFGATGVSAIFVAGFLHGRISYQKPDNNGRR